MAHVRGDVVIDVPPESQVYRQVVRKGLDVREFHLDPVVRLHYVEVEPPQLASPSGDLFRLGAALEAGKYGVTVAVHDRRTITAVWPGLQEAVYGVAIDIGSTTIAGHVVNLG